MGNEELVQEQQDTLEALTDSVIEYSGPAPEVLDTRTEQEKESDAILEQVPDVKPSAQDYGAAFIERHLAAARTLLKELGGNAVERVFMNVMAGEFSKREYKPVTENEAKLAHHFNECVTLRAKIVFATEFENLTKAIEKEEADLKKIDELTQADLTPEAKQLLAESGDKVVIKG